MDHTKIGMIIFNFLLIIMVSALNAESNLLRFNVMPMPEKIEATGDDFRLDENFTMMVTGSADDRLYTGASRALRRLSGRTGIAFSQDYIKRETKVDYPSLVIQSKRSGKVRLHEDESCQLKISSQRIELTAETDIGALHGLETLLQLLDADTVGYFFPGVFIDDRPRFPWRGLLIDVGRHFMPVDVIKRNLDGMAAVKMNVLHWHLSEDQGFRVESKIYPKLQEMGSDGLYYTQAQIKDVIQYAAERGIRVVPEFDVPGHSTSWLVGYPELGSAPGPYSIERKWGIKYPVMNPADESVYTFLDHFFGEMTALFPDDYFHIGGDEVEHGSRHRADHWNKNPEIQEFMKKNKISDNHALQAYFNNRILKIVQKHGKIMVGWEEVLHPDMPKNIVIQAWTDKAFMIQAAQEGYQSILSKDYYIDLCYPTVDHYLNDPLPEDSPLNESEKKKILGGEATMWTEFISPETIDSRIWPRTAAIAERLWSPGSVNDVDEMYRRLEIISLQLESLGLMHEKNYGMMLRRLANSQDMQALKNLVDVIEPVKGYQRNRTRAHTSYFPLTRVVDAARPDAEKARQFRKWVDQYIASEPKDAQVAKQIESNLIVWKENHSDLLAVIAHSPILREIQSLSEDLMQCAEIGLVCMDKIAHRQNVDDQWITEQKKILQDAKKPRAETELMIVSAIEELVETIRKEAEIRMKNEDQSIKIDWGNRQ